MPAASKFGHQLHRLEPINVFRVEKHAPDDGHALVQLERPTRQADAFDDQPIGINIEEIARRHELQPASG